MESPINSTDTKASAQEVSFTSQLEEMLAYGSSYVDTQVNSLKTSAKKSLITFFVEVSFIFFGTMTLFIAFSFLMYGIAVATGKALGHEAWLGFVITGGSVILSGLLITKFILFQTGKSALKVKMKQYEKELEAQREKFGHDMSLNSEWHKGSLHSDSQFLTWKAAVAKKAFLKTSENLKQEVYEAIDLRKWTQKYPIPSTGVAAATGFIIAGEIVAQKSKEASVAKTPAESTPDKNIKGEAPTKAAFVNMLIRVTEETLKIAMIPMVKDQLSSLATYAKENAKKMSAAKNIRDAQEKMDAEGGNQGRPAVNLGESPKSEYCPT